MAIIRLSGKTFVSSLDFPRKCSNACSFNKNFGSSNESIAQCSKNSDDLNLTGFLKWHDMKKRISYWNFTPKYAESHIPDSRPGSRVNSIKARRWSQVWMKIIFTLKYPGSYFGFFFTDFVHFACLPFASELWHEYRLSSNTNTPTERKVFRVQHRWKWRVLDW